MVLHQLKNWQNWKIQSCFMHFLRLIFVKKLKLQGASPPWHPLGTFCGPQAPTFQLTFPFLTPMPAFSFIAISFTASFTLYATLPGAWRYRVSAGTGQPGVSILWLGEMESLVCNFCFSVSARKIVWDTLACCWDVKQPTNKQSLSKNCFVGLGVWCPLQEWQTLAQSLLSMQGFFWMESYQLPKDRYLSGYSAWPPRWPSG